MASRRTNSSLLAIAIAAACGPNGSGADGPGADASDTDGAGSSGTTADVADDTGAVPECTADGDCATGEVCLPASAQCVPGCSVTAHGVELPESRPMVMVLVDRSSYLGELATSGAETRWEIARRAVEQLAGHDQELLLGLHLFPDDDAVTEASEAACSADAPPVLMPQADQGAAIVEALPAAEAGPDLQGASPLGAAMQAARDVLAGASDHPARAMVVVSDGVHNCGARGSCVPGDYCSLIEEEDPLPFQIAESLQLSGIELRVLGVDAVVDEDVGVDPADGVPLTNPFAYLDSLMSGAGLEPAPGRRFFDAASPAEIDDLVDSMPQAPPATCVFWLEQLELPVPTDAQSLGLYDGQGLEIPFEPAFMPGQCDDVASGWVFLPDLNVIELCGTACDAYQADPRIDLVYSC